MEFSKPTGISVLMCTYNGSARITETLTCLAQQDVPAGLQWEIIFVDNASTDNVAELAKNLWTKLGSPAPLRTLHESRPGYKLAMQLAISQIYYSYACIVDDDNRLATDYLKIGIEILESNKSIGILGGQNSPTFQGEKPDWFTTYQHCYAVGQPLDRAAGGFSVLSDGNVDRNVLWGAGMFVRTAIWAKLQDVGFKSLFTGRQGDKNLTAGEDDELCYVAQLLGYKVWYSSKLRLRHHMTDSRMAKSYRNQLFFASVKSANRLGAYRNALWGKAGPNNKLTTNMVKDFLYMSLGYIRSIVSQKYVHAVFSGNEFYLMNCRHQFLTLCDFISNFKKVKNFYETVLSLKQKVS